MRTIAILLAAAFAFGGCGGAPRQRPPAAGVGPRVAAPARAERRSPDAATARLAAMGLPVYCGGPKPYAALSFDDGPGVYTRLALRILRSEHVPATFFLVGRNMPRFGALARAEASAGYNLANHSYTHPVLPALSQASQTAELTTTTYAIRSRTGMTVKLFRPPYGARSPGLDAIVHRLGLLEVVWSVDSGDSAGANYAGIAHNVLSGLSPGAIILLHENRGQTIRALKFSILPALRRSRIHLVTIPKLLALDPPSAAQLRAGPSGCRRGGARTAGG